jgi:hypothetical protein
VRGTFARACGEHAAREGAGGDGGIEEAVGTLEVGRGQGAGRESGEGEEEDEARQRG